MEVCNMNEKWYVVENIADELEVSIVKLTEEEAVAVDKFLCNQKVIVAGEYVGSTNFFINKPYDTELDAANAVNTCDYYG
jgi:hypothetical protein